jgi:hypothetical protein
MERREAHQFSCHADEAWRAFLRSNAHASRRSIGGVLIAARAALFVGAA